MSSNEGTFPDVPELNNRGIPPSIAPETLVQEHVRDSDFYFPDGNTVFLVGNVMFKLQASLLAPRGSSTVQCRGKNSTTIVLFDFSKTAQNQTGTSDNTPISIPRMRPRELRVLLVVLLGWPSDPAYMDLLEDARSKDKHSQALLLRYLDIGRASYMLMLNAITRWAFDQVKPVLQSATHMAKAQWDESVLLVILDGCSVAGTMDVDTASALGCFFQLILSMSIVDSTLAMRPKPGSNLKACTSLFKSAGLSSDKHFLLGSTFPVLLSLGPHSTVWRDQLTHDERSMLYSAYAHLVNLQNNPYLQLGWLENPDCPGGILHDMCPDCSEKFFLAWQNSFDRIGTLNSPIPLEDVRKLSALPLCRQLFADSVKGEESCLVQCDEKALNKIDATLCNLFACRLVDAYHDINAMNSSLVLQNLLSYSDNLGL